ncbi:MAG: ATP-dependent helicase, partial [Alphaproteobacteria bacterium]|nr:ATP-dependent helicase [Alphaproteobacteria bacterium]
MKLTTALKSKLTEFDIRSILVNCLNIPLKYCREILLNFDKTKTLIDWKFENSDYSERYNKLINMLGNELPAKTKLSEQAYEIYKKLINVTEYDSTEITKFNFFIKQLEDFEKVFGSLFAEHKEDIIIQIENSIISENPYSVLDIKQNNIIIATPQKIIDNQIRTKYQFWLDISNNEWVKADTGPLYNAWVFQKGWNKEEYTINDNIELGKEKTARILRKLALCAEEHIYAYSSLFDGNGVENFGGIEKHIIIKTKEEQAKTLQSKIFTITPRDDQKPVLEYKSGQMAISAVPGAGKTTILLALIIKMLDSGINPQNIFVMTYMESAARNFRERIKSIKQDTAELPYISTIHGLALRILKENSNFERLGLVPNFDICDDTQRNRIIREVVQRVKVSEKDLFDFTQGLSVLKIGRGSFDNMKKPSQKLKNFKLFYEEYQKILITNNLIDYDDILIMAVRLLEENPDIREYYQNICNYIIEDEAQDSSAIQQRLINLLGGKHKNIIRCGDVNQAITTTFTNADVNGFREFIEISKNVRMNCSQRCTEDIWRFANKIILESEKKEETKNAFYHILMEPVTGKNPISENALHMEILDTEQEERIYILKEIKNTLRKNPKQTIGILVRNNKQVTEWTNYINNSGLKCITRSECLEQKVIFRTIYAILKIILSPFDNETIADSYKTLSESGLYRIGFENTIRKAKQPFTETEPDDAGGLAQFLWDINYWINLPHYTVNELAIKIGLFYYSGEIEKSNI